MSAEYFLVNHQNTLQKINFQVRISTVNVTKSADLAKFVEEILNGKLHFLCSENKDFLGICFQLNENSGWDLHCETFSKSFQKDKLMSLLLILLENEWMVIWNSSWLWSFRMHLPVFMMSFFCHVPHNPYIFQLVGSGDCVFRIRVVFSTLSNSYRLALVQNNLTGIDRYYKKAPS